MKAGMERGCRIGSQWEGRVRPAPPPPGKTVASRRGLGAGNTLLGTIESRVL
jgi:hypothetical protein